MDESVVVLGLLLGIRNLGDLLTVRGAKKSGSFHYFSWRADKGYCMKLAKPFRWVVWSQPALLSACHPRIDH